jgi:hypothetical protein
MKTKRTARGRIYWFSAALALLTGGLFTGCAFVDALDKKVETWGPPGSGIQGRNVLKVVKVLATYKATEKQKEVAQARAQKIYEERMAKALAAKIAAAKVPDPKDPEPKPVDPPEIAVKAEEVFTERYLAVETEPDDRAQGKSSVIIWDTHTQEIVGENVYDLDNPPQVGQASKLEPKEAGSSWETFTAEFVGAGL